MKTNASEIARWLGEMEIGHAFGIIGAGNIALWDAIASFGKTQIISVHHEQAAAMSSAYYNRVAGRLGSLVLLTTGGGAANSITGVLAAYMDSIPLLVLSGNEPSKYLDKAMRVQGVQGFQVFEACYSLTKDCLQLEPQDNALEELREAYITACGGRPGPVWLDIPRDVQTKEIA